MLDAHWFALRGENAKARQAFAEAVKRSVTIKDGRLNNTVAWWGTLDGSADLVLPACDAGVREHLRLSGKPSVHDTRGVALAYTGKLEEAASEFMKYVEWSKKYLEHSNKGPDFEAIRESFEPLLKKREKWVTELKAGRNPIDAQTLEALRYE
jgi:hypothetical protein